MKWLRSLSWCCIFLGFSIFRHKIQIMLQKISYVLLHYLLLMAFVFSSWGIGRSILQRSLKRVQDGLVDCLAITLGVGIFICLLQWLGIAGKLHLPWVIAIIGVGIAAGFVQIGQKSGIWRGPRLVAICKEGTSDDRKLFLIMVIIVASTLLAPLGPPLESDELSYHLPNAQQWALTGHLGISEWLRYPWLPNNYGLLYSAALIVGSDVLAHMVNACAGWLVALLIYQTGKRYTTYGVACLGVIIWIYLTRRDFDNAYIDMGTTLFVFAAAIAFYRWTESIKERTWLLAAAFFAGVAVGCKYQALGFLPVFAVALLFYERKPQVLLCVAACFLVPCIYWYARNLILTGDPFNPVGGKIFGFTNWNSDDYALQFQDLKNRSEWPSIILWTALLTAFVPTWKNTPSMRHAMAFCVYSVVIWLVTSRYPRYLMPLFPILALLAASGWQWLGHQGLYAIGSISGSWTPHPRLVNIGWNSLLIVVFVAVSFHGVKNWRNIAPSESIRDVILEKKVAGYRLLSDLKQHPVGRIYQFGINEARYYAPSPIWGDYFGPWRYSDFAPLPPDQLANVLTRHGFNHLLVNTGIWPHIASRSGFNDYFEEIRSDGEVKLYRIMD